jgi:polar amino acid transport system substrate-binding protein
MVALSAHRATVAGVFHLRCRRRAELYSNAVRRFKTALPLGILGGWVLPVCVALALTPEASTEQPARYGCDRPVKLAFYEFGPLYHNGFGIDSDVVEELARRADCRFDTVVLPRAEIWKQLAEGTLDVTTSGLRTDARSAFAYFIPYLGLKNVLITDRSKAAAIQSFEDVAEHADWRIGAVKGYLHGPYFDYRLQNIPRQIVFYADQNAIYAALRTGEVQAIISPAFNYEFYFRTPQDQISFAMIDVSPAPPVTQNMVFSRRRFSDAEINAWNRLLEQMRLDGTLERICRKHASAAMTQALLSY